jgi:hypothetical protein
MGINIKHCKLVRLLPPIIFPYSYICKQDGSLLPWSPFFDIQGKWLAMSNALAYNRAELIATVKSFIAQALDDIILFNQTYT